jgi:hypothetical protein
VVGINDRGDVVLRCNACGERSTVSMTSMRYQPIEAATPVDTITLEIEAMRAIGAALARLHDIDARQRVLRWALERFVPGAYVAPPVPTATKHADDDLLALPAVADVDDQPSAACDLSIDGVESMFAPDAVNEEPVDPRDNSSVSTMVKSFVTDFQRLAREWKEN